MNLIKKLFYKHTQRQTMLLELFCYKLQEAKDFESRNWSDNEIQI